MVLIVLLAVVEPAVKRIVHKHVLINALGVPARAITNVILQVMLFAELTEIIVLVCAILVDVLPDALEALDGGM